MERKWFPVSYRVPDHAGPNSDHARVPKSNGKEWKVFMQGSGGLGLGPGGVWGDQYDFAGRDLGPRGLKDHKVPSCF